MKKTNENLQEIDKTKLTKKERRQLKREQKEEELQKARRRKKTKKIIIMFSIVIGVVGGILGIILSLPDVSKLPPISSANHSEASPSSHIVTEPISEATQSHMLEHSDGAGPSGIIIQYNCEDFECEEDLIEKLAEITKDYPENVYLAPNNYNGKIILTKIGKREILDSFDEQTIRDFIEK